MAAKVPRELLPTLTTPNCEGIGVRPRPTQGNITVRDSLLEGYAMAKSKDRTEDFKEASLATALS